MLRALFRRSGPLFEGCAASPKKTSEKSEKGVDKAGEMMYTVKVAARETERPTSVIEN